VRLLPLIPAILLAACRPSGEPAGERTGDVPDTGRVAPVEAGSAAAARAVLAPVGDSGVEGTVRMVDAGLGVRVVAEVEGLPGADRLFALQVLATGSCDDLGDAPPHFDPDGARHGPFDAGRGDRHAGDLGNLRGYDGFGRYDRVDPLLALRGERSAVGHAVVVRAGPDDAYTPPDGAPGPVLACGVLEGR
jgi:Cu-Zn family superoxide dismutase